MRFVFFVAVLLVVAWYYVWRRIVLTSAISKGWRNLITGLLTLSLANQIAAPWLIRAGFYNGETSKVFFSTTFGWLGFMDILFFFSIMKDIIFAFWKVTIPKTHNVQRRLFVMRGLNLAALIMASTTTLLGTKTALTGPKIKKIKVPVKDLHADLIGLRIVQISDLHIGNLIQKPYVCKIVASVNSLDADFVMLTGDLADGPTRDLEEACSPLEEITSRLGKFYVSGNHEYYWNVDDWTQKAQNLGFTYLFNENVLIKVGGARLLIGGVPDFSCTRIRHDHVSEPKTSIKSNSASDFKILLAHQPKSCFEAYEAGYNLQLSGHTHNGQFFPNSLVIRFFHPYVKGLNLHKDKMWVYVNSGSGFWGPPQRLGVPAEITELTLVRA